MFIQIVYWSLVGWCGTPPIVPGPWPYPWLKNLAFGIVGGIAGGFLVQTGFGYDELVATSFGAFAGGRIISEVGGSFMKRTAG